MEHRRPSANVTVVGRSLSTIYFGSSSSCVVHAVEILP
jgi:hypothetical protein